MPGAVRGGEVDIQCQVLSGGGGEVAIQCQGLSIYQTFSFLLTHLLGNGAFTSLKRGGGIAKVFCLPPITEGGGGYTPAFDLKNLV